MLSTKNPAEGPPNWQALQSLLDDLAFGTKISFDPEALDRAGRDETEDLFFPPEAAVAPVNVREVSAIMRWASTHQVPVTPAGARTGLSGGALPVEGGLALSLHRMNAILEVDVENHQICVEPGVIVHDLYQAAAEKGLFYAVDPSSWGSCTIGGNIAENAGGPRAVKYGVTKDWVLDLQVVLPDGEIIQTGARTLKNSTGLNLTQLMVGSEGTLAVVTQATLKLRPLPMHRAVLLAAFPSASKACACVAAIFQAGIEPSALEFMEREAILLTQAFTSSDAIDVPDGIEAHLLIEVDAFQSDDILTQVEAMLPVLEAHDSSDPLFAQDAATQEKLWFLRRRVGEAVKATSVYKEEDTVVPRAKLPELLTAIKSIGKSYGFRSVCYGHAGDGNLHVNILKDEMSDADWQEKLPKAIRELFQTVVNLGGTLSGEHGIGWVQKGFMDIAFSPASLALMRGIKKVFDPQNILNPSKILPEEHGP